MSIDFRALNCFVRVGMLGLCFVLPSYAALACDTRPSLKVNVRTAFEQPVVRHDMTLSDIATLARKAGRPDSGARLGFYLTEFGYSVDVDDEPEGACPGTVTATVDFLLRRRVIEVAEEVWDDPCLHDRAFRHYAGLAASDEETVARFGSRVAAALSANQPVLIATDPAGGGAALRATLSGLIESAITGIHDARAAAQNSINTPSAVAQLKAACTL